MRKLTEGAFVGVCVAFGGICGTVAVLAHNISKAMPPPKEEK